MPNRELMIDQLMTVTHRWYSLQELEKMTDSQLEKVYEEEYGGSKPQKVTEDDEKSGSKYFKDKKSDLPIIRDDRKWLSQNEVLDLLMPQGSKNWNKVEKPVEDLQTEDLARIADALNNRLFFDPSVVSLGSNGASVQRGDIKAPPKMETEDQRLQTARRGAESARRTWNSGLMQAGSEYDQEMALRADWLKGINDLLKHSQVAQAIHAESDPELKAALKEMASISPDKRGLLRKILEMIFGDPLNMVM